MARQRMRKVADPETLIGQLAESSSINLGDLLGKIVDQMGGLDVFVTDFVEEFKDAPKGSHVKREFWRVVCRMVEAHTKNESENRKDLEDMPTEDLVREVRRILGVKA